MVESLIVFWVALHAAVDTVPAVFHHKECLFVTLDLHVLPDDLGEDFLMAEPAKGLGIRQNVPSSLSPLLSTESGAEATCFWFARSRNNL